jgi:hypothetical protein
VLSRDTTNSKLNYLDIFNSNYYIRYLLNYFESSIDIMREKVTENYFSIINYFDLLLGLDYCRYLLIDFHGFHPSHNFTFILNCFP